MIVENLTELDNDFITLWSKSIPEWSDYTWFSNESILNNLRDTLKNIGMEKLAELGQIDAILTYYLFININGEKNKKIDKIVDNLKPSLEHEFDQMLAKVYKNIRQNKNLSQSKNLNELLCALRSYDVRSYNMWAEENNVYAKWDFEDSIVNVKNAQKNMSSLLIYQTMETAKNIYENTQNPLYLERSYEISMLQPNNTDRAIIDFDTKLKEELKNLLEQNPDSPAIKFALAKFLMIFGKYGASKAQGQILLKELGKRPLSKTLQNYIEKSQNQPQ